MKNSIHISHLAPYPTLNNQFGKIRVNVKIPGYYDDENLAERKVRRTNAAFRALGLYPEAYCFQEQEESK